MTSNFLKAVFHKFYLVHSWIPWMPNINGYIWSGGWMSVLFLIVVLVYLVLCFSIFMIWYICMYVYMCMCIYICIWYICIWYICIHLCIHIHVYMYMCMYTYVYVYIYIYTLSVKISSVLIFVGALFRHLSKTLSLLTNEDLTDKVFQHCHVISFLC